MADGFISLSSPHPWDLVSKEYAARCGGFFEEYGRDALSILQVHPEQRLLDVATGAGAVALLAAEHGALVDAVDQSPGMLEQLSALIDERGLNNVRTHLADGQSLPFPDDVFDVATCMFGLPFYADRAAGFSELHRVLRPGGGCVVSSWRPQLRIEEFKAVFGALCAEMPSFAMGLEVPPLSTSAAILEEMSPCGFEVRVEEREHVFVADSMADLWLRMRGTFVLIALAEEETGTAAFEKISERVHQRLLKEHGHRSVAVPLRALLATGRRKTIG